MLRQRGNSSLEIFLLPARNSDGDGSKVRCHDVSSCPRFCQSRNLKANVVPVASFLTGRNSTSLPRLLALMLPNVQQPKKSPCRSLSPFQLQTEEPSGCFGIPALVEMGGRKGLVLQMQRVAFPNESREQQCSIGLLSWWSLSREQSNQHRAHVGSLTFSPGRGRL